MNRWLRWLTFNLWYLRRPPWDTGISPPELAAFIAAHPPGRALDLGCGTGTNAITLAGSGWEVTGVDFARRAVAQARRKARAAGARVEFHVRPVTDLRGIDGPFDLILDIGCYHGLGEAERETYQQNAFQRLAADGSLLLYAHLREADDAGHGVTDADLRGFERGLRLVERAEGHDRIGRRSVWLTFTHPPAGG